MSDVVIYEKKGRIAYIKLNRPEVMNAINTDVWHSLTEAWLQVRDDSEVWVAIVTGAGDKAFSAGADLKELSARHEKSRREGRVHESPMPLNNPMRGIQIWKPIIAAINGVCIAGGMELALACDFRIAAEHARLGLAEVKRGFMPGAGGTQRLPRLIGTSAALQLLLTGDYIDAQEAYRIGLINTVVPLSELMSTAEALADRICENGPLAVKALKEVVYRGITMNLEEALALEGYINATLMTTEDAAEGPKAFAEKRKPIFKGR